MIKLKEVNVGHYTYDTLVEGDLELARFYYSKRDDEWVFSSKLMNIEMDSTRAETKEDFIHELLFIISNFAYEQESLYDSILEQIESGEALDNLTI